MHGIIPMSLEQQIMTEMKDAMKSKNEGILRSLRAIKAEIIKAKTEPGAGGEIDAATEQKFLQKMMKQRKDSLEIFENQGREDLAVKEREELQVIERFLPKQMSESEIKEAVAAIIIQMGAASPADMGKVMGAASKQLAGLADGKTISTIVKDLLSK
ncbi:GatB/YqeY domain-containing protein [Ferruginibacter sp.]|uniref:GatB/YqeY domain-containing protein n=2 Tax=Ferruginibacter sp. TaxID=1940288 RepID=UPI00265A4512|nr:GatB/YqeY domain-containing protein [Ferruginibacter sp.]